MGWVIDRGEKVRFGFQNFCFRNRVVSEMLGGAYGLSRKLCVEFCVIFTKVGIYGLSLNFFEAKYGWEWLIYVKWFCVLLLQI